MSNPYNLFLVPTDELCHQEGAEGSMNPISSCGVKKKKKTASNGLCHLVLFLHSVSQGLMPRSLKAEHGQEPRSDLNSIPTQSMCLL